MKNKILACAAVALIAGTTSAAAATLITSEEIKDGTIQARDIKKGAITGNRLSSGVRGDLATAMARNRRGPDGATGPKGDTGAPGETGSQGVRGERGPQGLRGEAIRGDTGPAGPAGEEGPQGPKGDAGPAGATGQAGANGADGAPGAKGDKGDNGLDSDAPRVVGASGDHGVILAPYGDNSTVDGRGNENTVDDGTLTFAAPPAAPELGTRAARFFSKNGDPATDPDAGRSVVAYLPLRGRPLLSTLTYARYQSYVQDQPQSALDIAFKMEVFATGTATYQTLVYEPYQNGSDVVGQWVEHNVLGGQIWSSKIANANPCSQAVPCSIEHYLTLYPNARVLTAKFVIGQNSGQGWPGFVGWLDDARLGFNGQTVRYDLGG